MSRLCHGVAVSEPVLRSNKGLVAGKTAAPKQRFDHGKLLLKLGAKIADQCAFIHSAVAAFDPRGLGGRGEEKNGEGYLRRQGSNPGVL